MERKLAHIEIIEDIKPIEGADKIEVCKVLGWECVIAKKDNFKVGQKVCYIEVDSILPEKPEYEFLRDRKFRVKTIKLKGQVSQGLVIPISNLKNEHPTVMLEIGRDVTDLLGITKYLSPSEREEITQQERKLANEKNKLKKFMMRYSWYRRLFLTRKQKEGFPYWVSKTDEERIQNIPQVLQQFANKEVYVTEKIDYQSVTFTGKMIPSTIPIIGKFLPKKFKFVVCSRNLTTNDKNSLYWKIAKKYNLEQILRENPTLTIQGEQGDTKVQGNKYGIAEPTMWVFNIIDHEKNYHYDYTEMAVFCYKYNLTPVPLKLPNPGKMIGEKIKLSELGSTVQELVEFSKGKSVINPNAEREGIVVRCVENGKKLLSFKVINPDFLLKYD
jgi:tRNA-binding EMAP/Myf-like protein